MATYYICELPFFLARVMRFKKCQADVLINKIILTFYIGGYHVFAKITYVVWIILGYCFHFNN